MKNYQKYLNILFVLAVGFSGYTLARVYLTRRGLPAEACPISTFSTEIYLSIALCVLYFILSAVLPRIKR
ncbi:MAG: hypothetical protein XD91_1091 [Clostridiales bacterium 38_11]|nr:MAG: hypothetical protein XD91_1091 [Clostridiales bacterium 38_11]